MAQRDHLFDRIDATKDRGVIAIAEHPPDSRERLQSEILAEIDCRSARQIMRVISTAALHVHVRNVEVLANRPLNILNGEANVGAIQERPCLTEPFLCSRCARCLPAKLLSALLRNWHLCWPQPIHAALVRVCELPL